MITAQVNSTISVSQQWRWVQCYISQPVDQGPDAKEKMVKKQFLRNQDQRLIKVQGNWQYWLQSQRFVYETQPEIQPNSNNGVLEANTNSE